MFPPSTIQDIRSRANLVHVAGEYVRLRKAGAQYQGACPFHSEKTPSFTVHPGKQLYRCWGCGAAGDVFRFIQEIERVSFPEAVRRLADRAGVPLDDAPVDRQEYQQRRAVAAEIAAECDWFWRRLALGFTATANALREAERAACRERRDDDLVWVIFKAGIFADKYDRASLMIRTADPAILTAIYLEVRTPALVRRYQDDVDFNRQLALLFIGAARQETGCKPH